MSLLSDIQLRHDADPREVAQAAEALVLKQMLTSVHVGGKSEGPGAALHADLFAEALAEAVAKAGGLGLGDSLHLSNPAKSGPSPETLNDFHTRTDREG
ncbi:MAG TPA: hypothetical protein VLW85_05410 [Myxococcales bacterium]|nr:hypothetical protein [Myxococcales bacterium]